MVLPKVNDMYFDVLNILSDKKEYKRAKIADVIADQRNFSEEDRNDRLDGGGLRYHNRIGWTCTHLKKTTLIEGKRRGYVSITEEGLKILNNFPENLNNKYFEEHYPSFYEFQHSNKKEENNPKIEIEDLTPEDKMKLINNIRASELLESIMNNKPSFFEKLVVDLLLKMGYCSFDDAGKVTPLTNDNGIDGIIKEDKLGLENIYLQAKRNKNDNLVGRHEIQSFVGALNGNGASKGVFITTSKFTKGAQKFANSLNNMHIVLIDGDMLTRLMIEYNVSVTPIQKYEIKQLDSDYFDK